MDIKWQCQSVPFCRRSNRVDSSTFFCAATDLFQKSNVEWIARFHAVCPKTSVTNHEPSPRNIPEQRRSVINCLFLYIIFSLFHFSFLLLLFLSQTFYVVVFLKDTLLTVFGFETFLRDTLLSVLLVMKDGSYSDGCPNSDYITAILLRVASNLSLIGVKYSCFALCKVNSGNRHQCQHCIKRLVCMTWVKPTLL